MTIVRWNPYRDIAAMQRVMDRLFDDNWSSAHPAFDAQALALDVYETANDYRVTASLPGVNPENLNISYLDRTLTIAAETSAAALPEGAKALMNERYFGKFARSITLAQPVNSDHITADYVNGVLTLTLPKAESSKPRQIPVRSTINGNSTNN